MKPLMLALLLSTATLAWTAEKKVPSRKVKLDPKRFEKADVVLVVELVKQLGGSKYNWQTVRPLKILKNKSEDKFKANFKVANPCYCEAVPAGESVIYLVPYNNEYTSPWKTLSPKLKPAAN